MARMPTRKMLVFLKFDLKIALMHAEAYNLPWSGVRGWTVTAPAVVTVPSCQSPRAGDRGPDLVHSHRPPSQVDSTRTAALVDRTSPFVCAPSLSDSNILHF